MINPELNPFLADWAAAWARLPAGSGAAQRRAHFETIALEMRQPTPAGVTTEVVHVSAGETGRKVRVRIFRPSDAGPLPALIYMHGVAWMQGSPETHWDITADIAANTARVVISVDYALTPEHPFPQALNDCSAVVEWAFSRAQALGIRKEMIAIGGDSAGANLAAAQTLIHRGTPLALSAQLLVYPAVDFTMDRDSHRENADGPVVTVASMPAVNAMYCPNPADLTNPLAAPLRAASHAGLPPAFVAVAEHDPLRDEGLVYADALRAAGVPVELDRGIGLIHGYLRARPYCADARLAFDRMCDWLRRTQS